MGRAGRVSLVLAGCGVILGAGCPAPRSDDGPRREETRRETPRSPKGEGDPPQLETR